MFAFPSNVVFIAYTSVYCTHVLRVSTLFIYRVGQKNGLFFRLDNCVTVSPRKVCSMSKFSQFYREKGTKLAFQ